MNPRAFLLFALALAALSTQAMAATLPRDWSDERELRTMGLKSPRAAELLEQGEAKAAAGAYADAQSLFQRAHEEYADGAILWRRDCDMLVELGRRSDAILACSRAAGTLHSGNNERALISAFVDGPSPPTPAQLLMAVSLNAAERHKGLNFSVAAASCDIAERIGDVVMLQRCAEVLRRFNASDPATAKAEAVLAARCPPWRFWAGWGALLAAVGATLVHAAGRLMRRRLRPAGALSAATMLFGVAVMPGVARAGGPVQADPGLVGTDLPGVKAQGRWLSKFPIDDANPESSIPSEADRNADALNFGYWIQDVALKASHASQLGDHLGAGRFYEALAKAVPERATGFSKACDEYDAAGQLEKATQLCAQALLHDGLTVRDYEHFAHLMLQKPGRLDKKDQQALANVLAHMREEPAGRRFVDELECEVGARTSNVAQLEECTAALVARAPEAPKTLIYLWNLAVAKGDSGEAEKVIQRAAAAGVPAADLDRMRKATEGDATWRALKTALAALAVILIGAAALVAGRALVRKRREAAPANVPSMPPVDVGG